MKEKLSKKEIGERFKALRFEKGISQLNMATILNLSRSNYSQIERGSQFPTFETMTIFSDYYQKSYEWILHGDQNNNNVIIDRLNENHVAPPDIKKISFPKVNTDNKKIITVSKEEKYNYTKNSDDISYIDNLPVFEIPKASSDRLNITYRAFTISESNRHLSLNEDDIIIAKSVDNYSEIVFNNIYVIVKFSDYVVTRIFDFIVDREVFICKDNDDSEKTQVIKLADVKEIWMASGIYSTRSTSLRNELNAQVDKFETVLAALQVEIQQLKKLLKY